MNPVHVPSCARQQGLAAIEFALILPLLVLLLAFPLYFGRVFWYYAAAQKAAQNAVQVLAVAPAAAMKPIKINQTVELVKAIARLHMDELNPGTLPINVYPLCNGIPCDGYAATTTVRVVVDVYVEDIFFPDVSQLTISITGDATMPYAGK
jgi:hypothetical protein